MSKGYDRQPEERDLELENIIGNLMISEYQVDRLRTRLSDRFSKYYGLTTGSKNTSAHVFKHGNKWYKISISVEETDIVDEKFGDLDNNSKFNRW
jgi:hypothetical protein